MFGEFCQKGWPNANEGAPPPPAGSQGDKPDHRNEAEVDQNALHTQKASLDSSRVRPSSVLEDNETSGRAKRTRYEQDPAGVAFEPGVSAVATPANASDPPRPSSLADMIQHKRSDSADEDVARPERQSHAEKGNIMEQAHSATHIPSPDALPETKNDSMSISRGSSAGVASGFQPVRQRVVAPPTFPGSVAEGGLPNHQPPIISGPAASAFTGTHAGPSLGHASLLPMMPIQSLQVSLPRGGPHTAATDADTNNLYLQGYLAGLQQAQQQNQANAMMGFPAMAQGPVGSFQQFPPFNQVIHTPMQAFQDHMARPMMSTSAFTPDVRTGTVPSRHGAAPPMGPMTGGHVPAMPGAGVVGGGGSGSTGSLTSIDGFPTSLPVVLAHSGDTPKLSSHQILLRHQIEVFQATEDDATTHTRGRNKPIMIGQVGIRCKHCKHLPVLQRQKGSTYFPNTLLGIYQASQNMNTVHMQCGLCTEMPEEVKRQFVHSMCYDKVHQSGAGRPYWAEAAKKLGLVDTEEHGIRFIRDMPPEAKIFNGTKDTAGAARAAAASSLSALEKSSEPIKSNSAAPEKDCKRTAANAAPKPNAS